MELQLSGDHRKTYQTLFQHPIPHNLQWREVWSMLGAIKDAQAIDDDKGGLKVTRNGQTLTLRRPRGKDLADKQELMQVRHFLERSGTPVAPPAAAGTHLLVVIDHREARIYSTEMRGAVPQSIKPYDPFGFGATCTTTRMIPTGSASRNGRAFMKRWPRRCAGPNRSCYLAPRPGPAAPWCNWRPT